MTEPKQFLIEGLDRVGKDTLIGGIQQRRGYHLVLHYAKPLSLDYYTRQDPEGCALQRYQEDSFRHMFEILRRAPSVRLICNRAHLGEYVYAPLYRGYPADYIFKLEREYEVEAMEHVRLILLVEELGVSSHYVDDGMSLGGAGDRGTRKAEQDRFIMAFDGSLFRDKRIVNVTESGSGKFRRPAAIVDECLA